MIRRLSLLILAVVPFCFLSPVYAQSSGTVIANTASVYEQPSAKSEVLVELTKGKNLTVLDQKTGWLKVKVQLDKSFAFTGWINAKAVKWSKPATKAPVTKAARAPVVPTPAPVVSQAPPPAPVAVATQAPKTDLDQFFAAPPSSPPPSQEGGNSFSPSPAKAPAMSERTEFHFNQKAKASLGLGYLLYHYALSNRGGTTPGQIFAYNLPGFGIDFDSDYWFWENEDHRMKAGTSLYFQYGMYRFSTNLQDNTGTTFSTVNTKSASYDAVLKFPMEYRIGEEDSPIAVGGNVGFEYFKFSGDDVHSDTAPLYLYVSQATMSGLIGLFGRLSIPIPGLPGMWIASAGADVMVFSLVKESPKDATGTSPKGGIGFKPELKISWIPWDGQFVNLGYRVRVQGFTFSGTGSRVGTSNVDTGKVDTAAHEIFVGYEYHFR